MLSFNTCVTKNNPLSSNEIHILVIILLANV